MTGTGVETGRPGPMTMARLWATWTRRWRVVAACVLFGLLAGAGAYAVIPAAYTAAAVVLVSPVSTGTASGGTSVPVNMASERSTASSGDVLAAALERLPDQGTGGPDLATLRDSLSVTVPSGSAVLHVAATTGDPERSASWANAIAQAYLARRGEAAAAAARQIAERLQTDITQITSARASASAADRSLYDQQFVRLWERQRDVLAAAVDPGRVVTVAETPTGPSSPGRLAYLVGGTGLGLLLGAGIALIRDRWDPAVHDVEWLRDALPGVPVADDRLVSAHARRVLALAAATSPPTPRVVLVCLDGPRSDLWPAALRGPTRPPGSEAADAQEPSTSAPTLRIIEPRSTSALSGLGAWAGPGDLVVLEVSEFTQRAEVERVVAELGVSRARVGYVVFRPNRDWADEPWVAPTPPPAGADAPGPTATRAHPRRPSARKQEVSR